MQQIVTEDGLKDTPEVEPDEGQDVEPEGGDLEEEAPEITGGPGEEPEPTPKEVFKPKYKTHEEAEKAYAEAEKKMHDATLKAKEYEKQLERYQQTLKKLGGEKEQPKELSFRQKLMRQAHEAISKLNPEDPERDQKALDILAEANEMIADQRLNERMTKQSQDQANIAMAERMAEEAGVFGLMIEEDGQKYDLGKEAFWLLAKSPQIPTDQGIEGEVKWMIDRLQRFKQAVIEQHEAGKKGRSQPLGRGGKPPTVKDEEEGPSSLSEAIKQNREEKRIKK